MVGVYYSGELSGDGKIIFEDGHSMEVTYDQGYVHGLVRKMDCHGAVEWVGQYHRGHPCGVAWKLLPDGAIITG